MVLRKSLDTVKVDEENLPIKKSNCGSSQQETFLFVYKREHTRYINSDRKIQPADLELKNFGEATKIVLRIRNRSNSKDQFDEKAFWEWLQKNLEASIMKPYVQKSGSDKPNYVIIAEDDGNKKIQDTKNPCSKADISLKWQ